MKEVVPSTLFSSCHDGNCSDLVPVEAIDMYISYAYPMIKFTFAFPDIKAGVSRYDFVLHLEKNIPCQLLLEDKERFTRRPVIWAKEINNHDPAEFEFSISNESTVYDFALTLR